MSPNELRYIIAQKYLTQYPALDRYKPFAFLLAIIVSMNGFGFIFITNQIIPFSKS
jgi:hypothetical protein